MDQVTSIILLGASLKFPSTNHPPICIPTVKASTPTIEFNLIFSNNSFSKTFTPLHHTSSPLWLDSYVSLLHVIRIVL